MCIDNGLYHNFDSGGLRVSQTVRMGKLPLNNSQTKKEVSQHTFERTSDMSDRAESSNVDVRTVRHIGGARNSRQGRSK